VNSKCHFPFSGFGVQTPKTAGLTINLLREKYKLYCTEKPKMITVVSGIQLMGNQDRHRLLFSRKK
jgi:hypothetical protein